MAASSFFALLDDIATILDDVAILSKVAAKKTAGVLGDDLALNAQQVAGVNADRELPVVWAVALGSLRNKAILVPAALALSVFTPWLVTPLLMVGGTYLCYEGFEKVVHLLQHRKTTRDERRAAMVQVAADPNLDLVALEKSKIKGAIRTDFVLSAEIIVIALGTVAMKPFLTQVFVLSAVGIFITFAVYGIVGAIVKLDDLGLYLTKRNGAGFPFPLLRKAGLGLLLAAPLLMKFLSVVGTFAMFLVGGGILFHGIPHGLEISSSLANTGLGLATGLLAGVVSLGIVSGFQKLRGK
jgi:predicted DNA repair protein MutK